MNIELMIPLLVHTWQQNRREGEGLNHLNTLSKQDAGPACWPANTGEFLSRVTADLSRPGSGRLGGSGFLTAESCDKRAGISQGNKWEGESHVPLAALQEYGINKRRNVSAGAFMARPGLNGYF